MKAGASRRASLAILVASFLWGTSFVSVKIGLADLDPLWFLFVRILIASLLLLPWFVRGIRWRTYVLHPGVWLMGFFCAMGYVLQYVGMVQTTAGAAAFLINLGIVFVAIFSRWLLHEPFDTVKSLGVALAVAGAALLTGGGAGSSHGSLEGDLLILAGGLFWAGYTVGNKWLLRRSDIRAVPLTALVLFIAALWILPLTLLWGRAPERLLPQHVAVIAYMILFCTTLPFVLWTHGLRRVQPTVSAAILLMEPVFAALLAYVILHERFSPQQTLGAIIVFVAIVMVSLGNRLVGGWRRGAGDCEEPRPKRV